MSDLTPDKVVLDLVNTMRGRTHWEGCEETHVRCAAIKVIERLEAELHEANLVIQNYRLGGRWKGDEIDEIIASNERLREALLWIDGHGVWNECNYCADKVRKAEEALKGFESE